MHLHQRGRARVRSEKKEAQALRSLSLSFLYLYFSRSYICVLNHIAFAMKYIDSFINIAKKNHV